MNSKTLFLATALAILPTGAAFAQAASTPPADAASSPAATAETPAPAEPAAPVAADSPAAADTAPAGDAAAPASPAAAAPTAAATQADLKAGATVFDSAGATVGTIQSVTANGAVVASGKLRAEVPTASFAKNANGLVIGITKAEFEAAVNRAKS